MERPQLQQLADLIERFSGSADGVQTTAITGVSCIRLSETNARLPAVYTPCICVIVQGSKQVVLETETYHYEPSRYLAVSIDLPLIGEVTVGSREKPYLCLQLELDQLVLAELLTQKPGLRSAAGATRRGIFVGELDDTLVDCLLRLARLLDTPADIDLLAPMIKREIYYRLLNSPHGDVIAQTARAGSQMQRIAVAIRELKQSYEKRIRIEALASQVGMSVSSFHAHFKTVTAMSPLQYQKRLRLLEAQRIMLAETCDAVTAAYRVGYESASQFSREYARLFGNPPGRDIQRLAAATETVGVET